MQRPATSKMKIELPSRIISPPASSPTIAADVGRHIADIDIADPLVDMRGLPVVTPAVQHMRECADRETACNVSNARGSW